MNAFDRLGVDDMQIWQSLEHIVDGYKLCPDGKRLFMIYLFTDDESDPAASVRAWKRWIEHKNQCEICLGLKPRKEGQNEA